MVRHAGCFTRYATPATGLDSIEALPQIFSLRCARAAFSQRGGMVILELFRPVAWRFRDKLKSVGDENPWRRRDGDFSADWDGIDCACKILMARRPQSHERLRVSQCVRRSNDHRLRALLRRRRKAARVDELDSSRCRPGSANFVVDPHFARQKNAPGGPLRQHIARANEDRHLKSHYHRPEGGVNKSRNRTEF
jgi:hypothetical protein